MEKLTKSDRIAYAIFWKRIRTFEKMYPYDSLCR